ncbi:MAG: hypothetical protein JNM41_08520, partial [Flavipsychrobacter sp.]|nr:hypothetical protein [Flavipsychrobacter sp.]
QVLGEMLIHMVFPAPAGLDLQNREAIAAYMSQVPTVEFVLLLVNYAICSFVAGAVATFVVGRQHRLPAIIVGALITLGGVMNVLTIPQPTWFSALSLLSHLPLALLAYKVFGRPAQAESAAN